MERMPLPPETFFEGTPPHVRVYIEQLHASRTRVPGFNSCVLMMGLQPCMAAADAGPAWSFPKEGKDRMPRPQSHVGFDFVGLEDGALPKGIFVHRHEVIGGRVVFVRAMKSPHGALVAREVSLYAA